MVWIDCLKFVDGHHALQNTIASLKINLFRIFLNITKSRTGVFLSSLSLFVNSTLKSIKLISTDESKLLKSFYLTSDASTCENLKVSN